MVMLNEVIGLSVKNTYDVKFKKVIIYNTIHSVITRINHNYSITASDGELFI